MVDVINESGVLLIIVRSGGDCVCVCVVYLETHIRQTDSNASFTRSEKTLHRNSVKTRRNCLTTEYVAINVYGDR